MIHFHERIFDKSGQHEDHVREFSSKRAVIKLLKKSPFPTQALYELQKHDEVEVYFQEKRRVFRLVEDPP